MKFGVYAFHEGKEPKDLENEIKRLKKQLEIAVEALKVYAETYMGNGTNRETLENGYILEFNPEIAKEALNKIKELDK